MDDDFRRELNKACVQLDHGKQRALAEVRQYYYSLSPDMRPAFKEYLLKVAQAEEGCNVNAGASVVIECSTNWHSQYEDVDSVVVGGRAVPRDILAAIEQWDNADEQDPYIG
jgi:hypothetical protein